MDCNLYLVNSTSHIAFLLSSINNQQLHGLHELPADLNQGRNWTLNRNQSQTGHEFLSAETFRDPSTTVKLSANPPSGTSRHILQCLTLVVIPIAILGMLGNMLNIFVLTRKQLLNSLDRMEKSVNVGLVALAVSDFLFCLLFLAAISPEKAMYSPLEYSVLQYFRLYQEALLNVLQLSSTWLTVNMAVGRYFAICKPLHARGFISLKGTRVAVTFVFLGSIFFNLPRFFYYHFDKVPCTELLSGSSEVDNRSLELNFLSTAQSSPVNFRTSPPPPHPPPPDHHHHHPLASNFSTQLENLERLRYDERQELTSTKVFLESSRKPFENQFRKRRISSTSSEFQDHFIDDLEELKATRWIYVENDDDGDDDDDGDGDDGDGDGRDDDADRGTSAGSEKEEKHGIMNADDLCGCHFLMKKTSELLTNPSYILTYGLASSIVSIFFPLIILSSCNVCLIRALRRSCRMQALYRANKPKANSGHRITATLIFLIVLFILLVTPADLIVFARLAADVGKFRSYELLTHLANLLLLTNFSLNFILYCVVNAQFRSTLRYLVTCGLRCCSSGKLQTGRGLRGRDHQADCKLRMVGTSANDEYKAGRCKRYRKKFVQKSLSNSFASSAPSVPMVTMASEACTFSEMEM